ncbi:hypothetical protein [Desulfosporosinus shakirovi]|uniref:hypothetical protein n=1 Tax=Desulfosporosinus shakirovi TaxID=2885154 RepID=UPI001E485C8F|nr:hypothetical protein [Desulfosporosinus sp. SRJS8]MCB8818776.1 hypothetical protein [Desulfosporosinus sp. SRJS8]
MDKKIGIDTEIKANKVIKFFRGGNKHMHAVKASPIKATVIEGHYAQDVIKELMSKPSPMAIIRNKRASDLVKKLRK